MATGGARPGTGGSRTGGAGTGGGTGGTAATGGAPAGSGGSGGTAGTGGTAAIDADPGPRDAASVDVAAGDVAVGSSADTGAGSPSDAPPSAPRPDAMGAPCATGSNYNFTIRAFGSSQRGVFTAYFTANPGPAPTNSVIGLSDGQKYIHDDYAAIVRFGTSGNLDVRNGAAYMSATPIKYENTDYHFRLVVNVPAHTYSAYVAFKGMPEVTLGTNMAFRDSAGVPAQFSHWGVEAIAGHTTRVCDFLVVQPQ